MLALRVGCCLVAFGSICSAPVAAPASLDDAAFLAGSWTRSDDVSASEEHWLPARGGMMLGLYRKVRTSGRVGYEYLRIEQRDDGVYYVASPSGQNTAAFKLIESSPGRLVFENPEHDYPTRIIYETESENTLRARIEGKVDGEPRHGEWRWTRSADAFRFP